MSERNEWRKHEPNTKHKEERETEHERKETQSERNPEGNSQVGRGKKRSEKK